MPNINDVLRKRMLQKKQQKVNKVSKIKRSFSDQQKYIEKDQLAKLKGDKLADKKMEFYNSLFGDSKNNDDNNSSNDTATGKTNEPKKQGKAIEKSDKNGSSNNFKNGKYVRQKFNREQFKQQIETKRKEKQAAIDSEKQVKADQRKKIKKIFTERTKTGQPVMKNYINYLVEKIEKEKKGANSANKQN